MLEKEIEAKVKRLPEQLRGIVLKYVDFLLQQEEKHRQIKQFNFNWEGKLKEVEKTNNISSVELQHKSIEWR